eukprot:Awhi_evm1s14533
MTFGFLAKACILAIGMYTSNGFPLPPSSTAGRSPPLSIPAQQPVLCYWDIIGNAFLEGVIDDREYTSFVEASLECVNIGRICSGIGSRFSRTLAPGTDLRVFVLRTSDNVLPRNRDGGVSYRKLNKDCNFGIPLLPALVDDFRKPNQVNLLPNPDAQDETVYNEWQSYVIESNFLLIFGFDWGPYDGDSVDRQDYRTRAQNRIQSLDATLLCTTVSNPITSNIVISENVDCSKVVQAEVTLSDAIFDLGDEQIGIARLKSASVEIIFIQQDTAADDSNSTSETQRFPYKSLLNAMLKQNSLRPEDTNAFPYFYIFEF